MHRSLLGASLLVACLPAACVDIPPLPADTAFSSSSGDPTGTTTLLPTSISDTAPPITTGPDDDSSSAGEPGSSSESTGSSSSTSDEPSTSSGPASSSSEGSSSGGPECGNERQEADEACDGVDLAGLGCTDVPGGGFTGGRLACAADCTFDTSACTACGNGLLDAGEACDGAMLGGLGCGDLGFSGGTLDCGDTCDHDTSACSLALWISEYAEGSGNNKAVEIYNPSPGAVDTASCELRFYFNGSAMVGNTVALTGMVAPDDVLVVCDDGIIDPSVCDVLEPGSFFNGDDAVELWCNGATLDVLGQIGFDPGLEWQTGGVGTQDATLRRSCAVSMGDAIGADAFDPSLEWVSLPQDTLGDLGQYVCP